MMQPFRMDWGKQSGEASILNFPGCWWRQQSRLSILSIENPFTKLTLKILDAGDLAPVPLRGSV